MAAMAQEETQDFQAKMDILDLEVLMYVKDIPIGCYSCMSTFPLQANSSLNERILHYGTSFPLGSEVPGTFYSC